MKNRSKSSLEQQIDEELETLRHRSLLRRPRTMEPQPGGKSIVDGRLLVSFGSNDYLGLSLHPELRHAACQALFFGTGATGSRLTSGNFSLHRELERVIAEYKHTEDAIFFSTGYSANIGVIPALVGKDDLILSDSLNHASLIDGCRLSGAIVRVYKHSDMADVRAQLTDREKFRRLLIITDGVFSMDGDLANLPELADISDRHDGWLMVDDAHGTGVFGQTGSGTVEHFGLIGRIPIQMGTLSKALGTAGGFVAGSSTLIELLRNKARSYMFSTAPTPANAASAIAAINRVKSEPATRERLKANIAQFREGLAQRSILTVPSDSPIVPLIIGSADDALKTSAILEEEGFWVPAIRPPTVPDGLSRLRITITAAHLSDDIAQLLRALSTKIQIPEVATVPFQ